MAIPTTKTHLDHNSLSANPTSSGTISAAWGQAITTAYVGSRTPGEFAVALQLSGVWTGTVSFLVSYDDQTWLPLFMTPIAGGNPVTSATSNGTWLARIVGATAVVAVASAWSSGSAGASPSRSQPIHHPRMRSNPPPSAPPRDVRSTRGQRESGAGRSEQAA